MCKSDLTQCTSWRVELFDETVVNVLIATLVLDDLRGFEKALELSGNIIPLEAFVSLRTISEQVPFDEAQKR